MISESLEHLFNKMMFFWKHLHLKSHLDLQLNSEPAYPIGRSMPRSRKLFKDLVYKTVHILELEVSWLKVFQEVRGKGQVLGMSLLLIPTYFFVMSQRVV